jgi:hypothetical protein
MRNYIVVAAFFILLSASFVFSSETVTPFSEGGGAGFIQAGPIPAMKSVKGLLKVADLANSGDLKALAKFVSREGKFLETNQEIFVLGYGCGAFCLQIRIKGDPDEYWIPSMYSGKVSVRLKK